MAQLTAVFSLIDKMSNSMESIASRGLSLVDHLERAASSASDLFDTASSGSATAERAIDGVAMSCQSMSDSFDLAAESIANGSGNLDEFEQAVQTAADAAAEFENASSGAAGAAEDFSGATADAADQAEEGAQRTITSVEQLSSALAAAGITQIVSEMADALMEAPQAAAEFETATMKISTIADTSAVSLSQFSSDITALSMETGVSVNELSEAAYSALSASVETASAVNFTATATKLAAGGFTSSSTAVDVLTTALNAYGLEANKATSISDMLITTQNLGKTTVDELAASVGKVIPLASAYGVEMDNLSAAYAELTKSGIATAEAGTYLKSMLNELGDSGSTVSAILKEQTGSSFAQLMEQGYSLGDVMDVLGESVGGNAGAFNELWSSSEAGIGALSLYNAGAQQFNSTLDAMQSSIGATDAAYETMTDTTAHAQEELSNAAANLQVFIGQQVNPLMEKLYIMGAKLLNGMTEFTQEHPIVTKAIIAIGVGLAGVAVGFAGVSAAVGIYNGVMAISTAMTATFGVTLSAALWPITAVAAGIAAVVGVAMVLADVFGAAEDETAGMTAATRAQYYELQDLNAEYERACEQYGETSEEASRLKYQVDDLSASFEANRQTVEEFTAEVDALAESVTQIGDDFSNALSEINANEVGALALIQKYEDLASKADRTAAEEKALAAVNKQPSASYPEIAQRMGTAAVSTEDYVEALKKACEQEAEEQRQQQAQDTYIEALQKRAELTEELAKAQENVNLEQERMDNMSGWEHFWTDGEWDDLKAYQAALDELNAAQAENEAIIAGIEQQWDDLAAAEAEAAEATVSYEDAVGAALSSVQEDIDALCAAYDAAFESARSSIDGQIGLFDTMATETELSITDMQTAFDSQIAYLNTYSENLSKAAEYGLDDGLIASLSDGSEESAGYLNAIIENIEALGDSSSKAQAFVDDFNSSFQEVEAAKDEFAATVATMETDFDTKMAEIEGRLDDAIDNMNMEADAAAAAKETMDAYTQSILDGTANAVSAAESAAAAVARALNTSYSGGVVTYAEEPGYATGTTNAEDVFIAGEEGPELIVGKAGSTVFPASETDRLINAVSAAYDNAWGYPEIPTAGTADNAAFSTNETGHLISVVTSNYDDYSTSYTIAAPEPTNGPQGRLDENKHITLEVGGGAPIQISGSGGISQDEVADSCRPSDRQRM